MGSTSFEILYCPRCDKRYIGVDKEKTQERWEAHIKQAHPTFYATHFEKSEEGS